ncbi:MAG: tRNA (guanosine(46)-N7)-methyltransferase TrmB [Lachnospiraceae bacterium]|nr:tRNA (guanosine(46)-N7)-methyltransferase TrmB [Lachnospiraceae bacterium]
MRQRRIKGLEEKLNVYNGGIVMDPCLLKGKWQKLFGEIQPLYLELGCGKGQFASMVADAHPEHNILAMEGNRNAMLRALQKAARRYVAYDASLQTGLRTTPPFEKLLPYGVFAVDSEKATVLSGIPKGKLFKNDESDCVYSITPNLAFINMYLRKVEDCFAENELDGIYLNFSDPWPKARQAPRRLTHRGYLEGYRRVLCPGGYLEFKTDNEGLFRFSMEEFRETGLEIVEYTEDLHAPDCTYSSAAFMTEYETKFSAEGKRIYYCKVEFL